MPGTYDVCPGFSLIRDFILAGSAKRGLLRAAQFCYLACCEIRVVRSSINSRKVTCLKRGDLSGCKRLYPR